MNKTQIDETKYGYVYSITNLINSKTYNRQLYADMMFNGQHISLPN